MKSFSFGESMIKAMPIKYCYKAMGFFYNTSEKACLQEIFHTVFQRADVICDQQI